MRCTLKHNRNVPCAGRYILSEGLCLKHAILFDVWICEYDGYRIYRTDYPLNWKRSKVHQWLNKLGNQNAQKILNR